MVWMFRRSACATATVWSALALSVAVPAQSASVTEELPAAGNMLVASPNMRDRDFVGAVILIVHSGQEGVIGLMLNRTSGFPLSHLFPEIRSTAAGRDPLYLGGVIALGVRALLRSPLPQDGAQRLLGGVWMLSNSAAVEKAARRGGRPENLRVYAGYVGWSRGQLRKELLLGHWRVLPGSAEAVFDPHPETLWKRISARAR